LAALLFLEARAPQFWVMEIGLGGRLDAVNWLTPTVSIVTRIALDHQQWLGSSLAQVAREKCGIFRPSVPAIFSDPSPASEVLEVVTDCAQAVGVSQLYSAKNFGYEQRSQDGCFFGLDAQGSPWERLTPSDQIQTTSFGQRLLAVERLHHNAWTAALQACMLTMPQLANLSDSNWQQCWANTGLAGRFQRLKGPHEKLWLCDVAHNLDAVELLIGKLQMLGAKRIHLVFGVLDDKPWQNMIDLLIPFAEHWWVLEPDCSRAVPVAQVTGYLKNCGQAVTELSVLDDQSVNRYHHEIDQSTLGAELVLVCGSFYTVGPFIQYTEKAPLECLP